MSFHSENKTFITFGNMAFNSCSVGYIQKCMPSIYDDETTLSHVTFAADPLVFKRPHLLTFSSRKSSFHDEYVRFI